MELAVVQPASTEPPVTAPSEVATSEKKPETPPTRTFAIVAKREKALQRQREELASQRKAFESERQALQAKMQELEQRFAKPESPVKALERYGYSYKDATDFVANDSQPTAEQIARSTRAELEAFKRQQEDRERQQQEAYTKAKAEEAEKTISEYKTEIKSFTTGKDDYELINLYDGQELVYHVVEEHFTKTGRVLNLKEACDEAERFLTEQAEKTFATKRFKAKLPSSPETPKAETASSKQEPSKTISNEYTPSTPSMLTSPKLEDDRMKRAMAALSR